MKALLYIMVVAVWISNSACAFAQEQSNSDTSVVQTPHRPHIIYVEVMGRAGYWNIGYGYSFFQRNKHELNAMVGFNYMYYWDIRQISMFPVGVFYRFGERFKFEGGFSVTPIINWPRFRGELSYDDDNAESVRVLDHQILLVPSVGFVYGTKNGKFEFGARYTPQVNPIALENTIPYVFGTFFTYRLTQKEK